MTEFLTQFLEPILAKLEERYIFTSCKTTLTSMLKGLVLRQDILDTVLTRSS